MNISNSPLALSIDLRWDSAIDRLEQKYGLHLDSWRRLGPNQRGKPCGRGWVGLRGACKRGKKADDNAEKIKASKVELADKIRAKKGMRDRNAPKPVVKAKKVRTVKAKSIKAPVELLENPGILPYKKVQELGKGAFGTAILTDRGTVVKIPDRFDATWIKDAQSEFEALKQFEKLGIGPKAIGFEGKTIEMGLVKGKTVKQINEENIKAGIGSEVHHENQMKAAKALLKLHQSGWVHGDAHDENVLIDKDGTVKLIDAGYAAKVGATVGNSDADTGYEDISRALEGHPDFPKFEAAMEPYTDVFHDEMTAAWGKHNQKFRRKRTREARVPVGNPIETTAIKQKLHEAYLRIAEQFIK